MTPRQKAERVGCSPKAMKTQPLLRRTRRALLIGCLLSGLLPLLASAQSLPYTHVIGLQNAIDAFRAVEGMSGQLTLTHQRPDDTRPFQIFLEAPTARTEIKVDTNGMFRLPKLPKDDWEAARVTHTLEKGALSVNFFFGFEGALGSTDATVYDYCVGLATKMGKVLTMVVSSVPDLADLQVTMVGVAVARTEPARGKVLLKRGDRVVASADLSETGKVVWPFDKYDPKEHRVVWETEDEDQPQRFHLVLENDPAAATSLNAIPVPRTEQALTALVTEEAERQARKSQEPVLLQEQSNLFPETNVVYRLVMPPTLYRTVQPGPKEERTSRGWQAANEFVFRTALRLQLQLPAQSAVPHRDGVLASFRVQDSDRRVRVFVRSDLRTVEYRP